MRQFAATIFVLLLTVQVSTAQANQDFSGVWNLNPARSEIQSSIPADATLKVEQNVTSMTWSPA